MRAGFDPDNMTVTVHSRVLGHLDWGSSDPRHHRLTNDDLLDIYAKVQQRVVHGLSRGRIKRSLSDSSGDTRRQSTVKLKSTKNQRDQPPICEIKHVQITDDSPNGSYAAFARWNAQPHHKVVPSPSWTFRLLAPCFSCLRLGRLGYTGFRKAIPSRTC